MDLLIYLDDAMKVLLQHGFLCQGYIDDSDGSAEVVRSELEQKCYFAEQLLKEKENEHMDKLRAENSELIQRVLQLEKELAKERTYNDALVTAIKKGTGSTCG
jgi:hypothetical protein